MSHGWGSWGIVDVIESLLGVSVTSPGGATVKIAPPAVDQADLSRVSGSAWTQRGTVSTAWKKVNGTYVLDVTVPTNVKATVAIPNPGGTVNYVGTGAGAPVKTGDADGRTLFTVGSGTTHFSIGSTGGGTVGGSVPATLSLTLGSPAAFGAFVPGVDRSYDASTTATVISTAGDAALSVNDPSANATGRLVNGAFALSEPLQARANSSAFAPLSTTAGTPLTLLTYSGPVSNDAVSIGFRQHIGASQPLRSGSYAKSLTFTLSTTTP